MSERELREAMRYMRREHLMKYAGLRVIETALAAEPDVVVLAREIEERLVVVDSWLRENCNLASHDGYVGMQNALDSLQDYIQEEFHVRLTDDGWEWVEEGE